MDSVHWVPHEVEGAEEHTCSTGRKKAHFPMGAAAPKAGAEFLYGQR